MTRIRLYTALALVVAALGAYGIATTHQIENAAHDEASRSYLITSLHLVHASSTPDISTLRRMAAQHDSQVRPVFDVSDVDPDSLARAVTQLESSIKDLVGAQNADSDRLYIKKLYPLKYLNALAVQEKARRAFVASGSETDAHTYDAALDAALAAARSDLATFNDAFTVIVGTNKVKLIGYGGLTDTGRMHTMLAAIDAGIDATAQEIADRRACIAGSIEHCTMADLATSTPRTKTLYPSASMIHRAQSVRTMLASLRGMKMASTSMPVLLASSRCLAALARPPIVFVVDSPQTSELQYAGDIFLIPTDPVGETTSAYMHTKLGLPYSLGNPYNFYICPDGGIDTAHARAALATATFARTHPKLVPSRRAALMRRNIITEKDARDYLAAAMTASSTAHAEVVQLMRAFASSDAGLDALIEHIAATLSHDATLAHTHVPFNLKPRNLYLTHSAFASLWQTYNPTFGSTSTPLSYPDSLAPEQIYAQNLSYFDLIKTTSAHTLQAQLRAYVTFEQGAPTSTSAK